MKHEVFTVHAMPCHACINGKLSNMLTDLAAIIIDPGNFTLDMHEKYSTVRNLIRILQKVK